MKKTATLQIYTPYGTTLARVVDVLYRGRVLHSFSGHKDEVGNMLQKAMVHCQNRGFANTKTVWLA